MSWQADRRRIAFVAACTIAGAIAVPLHPVATPVSAAIAAMLALAGWWIWNWSRLPQMGNREAPAAGVRPLWAGAWIGLGLAIGLLTLAVIRFAIEPSVPEIGARIAAAGEAPVWRRLLIIYVAAVGEELLFRVILLSAIAGLAARLRGSPGRVPGAAELWVANGLSALAFAAVHLPAWSAIAPGNTPLAASVLTLNAVAGLVLGYVFATRGILAAILAHAGADGAVQLIGPLTG